MRIRSIAALLMGLAVLFASSAGAQQRSDLPGHGWEISPYVGGYDDAPEFDLGRGDRSVDPESNPLFGGRFGYRFPSGLFLNGEVGYIEMESEETVPGGTFLRQDMDVLLYGASVGYGIPLHERFELFGVVGAGASRWDPDQGETETDFSINYGAGSRIWLTPSLALRGDVRLHQVPDALSAAKQRAGIAGDETFWGLEFSGGVSVFLGGRRDSDGDGVRDERDACPDTPAGAAVDERGCALDGDGDGVPDHADRCPDTPSGARVDERGCALDGDGDGVPDGIDQCPDTPSGARVNERGCALDGDGDGVPDGIDQCPDTPSGARVDERGCALDGDGDGVPDGIDRCPDTHAGAEVDASGCEILDLEFEPVLFDFDEAEIRDSAVPILRRVGEALVDHPEVRVEIQGHADEIGSPQYNESLSARRAEAVRSFLLENFSELESGRVELRAFGETRPAVEGDTEEARQRNRRAEIVIVAPAGGGNRDF